jgi:uncharacterized BrkB/YihY/UPF0761 family membrane protein
LTARVSARYERLAEGKRLGPVVAVVRRFFEIDGLDAAGLLAVELFTVVIPLILLGFSYASRFSNDLSFGDLLAKRLNLSPEASEILRSSFSDGAELRSTWTVLGLGGFLIWGLGTAPLVCKIFAGAWRRERFSTPAELGRGFVWFLMYITTASLSESAAIRAVSSLGGHNATVGFVAGLVPIFVLWSLTPLVLLRDGSAGWRFLVRAGVAGVLIDGVLLRLVGRIVFPALLEGWVDFGPIGVAMALMTWCGIQAIAWVLTACVGAVMWERAAPVGIVVDAQTGADRTDTSAE